MISQPEITTTSSQWQKQQHPSDEDDMSLEKLLRDKSKHGVFEADFENQNGTTVTVRDGDSVILNCRVYLLHDKTVSTYVYCLTLYMLYSLLRVRGTVLHFQLHTPARSAHT